MSALQGLYLYEVLDTSIAPGEVAAPVSSYSSSTIH